MTVDIMECMEDSLLLKAGNNMALVLMELENTMRIGIPIEKNALLNVVEMIDVALARWQEATAPPEEV